MRSWVSPSSSASSISSRQGQIVSWDWPPGSSSCSNPHSDGPPPSSASAPPTRAVDTDEEEFGGSPRAANCVRLECGCRDRVRTADRPAAYGKDLISDLPDAIGSGPRAAKCARLESGCGDRVCTADRPAADGRDRISDLPDAVLLSILSLLPLRDAGRTAVLSSRWRGLFDQSLLDFNACQPFPPEGGRGRGWFIRAITDILAARPRIRIRSFRFVMYGWGFEGRLGVVDGWFRSLARHGVREIDVDMFYAVSVPTLPGSLLDLASLETLNVHSCIFPNTWPRLPALKILDLSSVNVSQDSLQAILSNCNSLECVKLKNIVGLDKICLRSKSLARLYGDFGDLEELVVEDAPNLEELVGISLPSGKVKVRIVSAPKLQVLGYLGITVRPLILYDTVYNGGTVKLSTMMHSVKTLAIQVPFSEKGYTVFVAQLLKCFPCLDVLRVEPNKQSISQRVSVEEWDTANSIKCIEHSINRVVFEYFGGEDCQLGFLNFLLRMATALKLVELYCWTGKDWDSDHNELVEPKHRASPDAKIQFMGIYNPASGLFLCHCCTQRCQKENRVALL